MKSQYYVMMDSEDLPKHESSAEAKEKAESTAKRFPGSNILILQTIGISYVPAPTVSTLWLDHVDTLEESAHLTALKKAQTQVFEHEATIRCLQREIDRIKTL